GRRRPGLRRDHAGSDRQHLAIRPRVGPATRRGMARRRELLRTHGPHRGSPLAAPTSGSSKERRKGVMAEYPDLLAALRPQSDLRRGDCLDVLRELPDNSIDAVITDPPYGLADHKPERIEQAVTAWTSGDREHVP